MANALYGRCEANKPITISRGNMAMVFAPAQFWPTYWLAKERFSHDFSYYVIKQLSGNEARTILIKFGLVNTWQINNFNGASYKKVLLLRMQHDKVKVYIIRSNNLLSTYRGDSFLSVNCKSVLTLENQNNLDVKAVRDKLAIELSQILMLRRGNKIRLDDIYWSRWWITRQLIVAGSVIVVFAESIVALLKLAFTIVEGIHYAVQAALKTLGKLASGDFQAVQRDLQRLVGGVVQGIETMAASLAKGYDIVTTIWSDGHSKKLLFAFMKEYVDGTSVVDSATFKISLTIDVVLIIGTLGAGAVVVGARLAHRVGQFTVRALQFIVELWRTLKLASARRIIKSPPPVRQLPAPKAKSGKPSGSGDNNGTSGTGNDSSSKPDLIGTSNGDVAKISDLTPSKKKAVERELRVAEIVGGKSATRSRIREKDGKLIVEDTPVLKDGKVVTGIDVFGKNGELIQVGGPGKNANDVVFEKTKKALKALKEEAQKRGTKAQVYYEQGNSDRFRDLIKESQKILGKDNVFILPN